MKYQEACFCVTSLFSIKKEVKTHVLTSRGGGVLHGNLFGGSAACPARQDCSLTRCCFFQSARRLTTKGLAFQRFVAPGFVAVNRKILRHCMCFAERNLLLFSPFVRSRGLIFPCNPFLLKAPVPEVSPCRLLFIPDFPHESPQCRWAIPLLQRVRR